MDNQPKQVRAKFAFKATNNDELTFLKGDVITITQQVEGGWWEGTFNGKTGWFPCNYTIELRTEDKMPASPTITSVEPPIKEQHHVMVTKSLVESEAEYVNELRVFIQTYLGPLSSCDIILPIEYSTLCGNLQDILDFHEIFLNMLNDCARLPVGQQRIGGIFLSNAKTTQDLYQIYSSNHPQTVSIISKHREELNAFLEQRGASPPGSMALIGYLSIPFRRLDKYPSMLKELERHIDDAHIDRGDTQRAISVYRDIHSTSVEIRKEKEMEIDILSGTIKNWEGEDLNTLGQVQMAAQVKVYTDANSSNDRILFLFSSCILMISTSSRLSYSYQGKIMLAGLKVKKLDDTEEWSNALELSGSMIDVMIVSFTTATKMEKWFDYLSCFGVIAAAPISTAKSVKPSTMPAQVSSKASVKSISNSAKTAKVLDSCDRLGVAMSPSERLCSPVNNTSKPWTMWSLRPMPPTRPTFLPPDESKSPKVQRKASTLGRRKNVDDSKVLQEDARILKVIEAYCTSARTRHTVNSSILDNPNMLIAEDEKIICEITKDNETVIEEKSLVDTVYVIKDQIRDLQQEHQKLKRELEDERKARQKLETMVQKHLAMSRLSANYSSKLDNS